jgi:hypothetical protein
VEEKDDKLKEAEHVAAALGADEDDEDSSLFYNDLMPMMVRNPVVFCYIIIILKLCSC